MQSLLKSELDCSVVEPYGSAGGGCNSSCSSYTTDKFGAVFVKTNKKDGAKQMFDGEAAGLEALAKTDTVKVPKPIKVFDHPNGGSVFVVEYLDIHSLNKYGAQLGEQLARLHLHNRDILLKTKNKASSVHTAAEQVAGEERFGFHCVTCCGYYGQDNTWETSWLEFLAKRKLQHQVDMIEKEYGDRKVGELWTKLQRKLPQYFKDLDIFPSLLHGDLWSGNAADTADGAVIYDPASFYGHHEFDLGIAKMFGGFPASFWKSYHTLIPQAPGFNQRNQLYQLFHYLNHWTLFGSGYRESALSIMKELG